MSTNTTDNTRKVTTRRLGEMKQRGEKISMLTAYDYSSAKILPDYTYCCCVYIQLHASTVLRQSIG